MSKLNKQTWKAPNKDTMPDLAKLVHQATERESELRITELQFDAALRMIRHELDAVRSRRLAFMARLNEWWHAFKTAQSEAGKTLPKRGPGR